MPTVSERLLEVMMRSGVRRWAAVSAWLAAGVILVQAVLAGRGLFADPALFGLHGGLGTVTLLLTVAAAALAWFARASSPLPALLASFTVIGVVAQTGLGYAGRRSGLMEASAAHVPLGVALLGLSVAVALLLSRELSSAASSREVQ